MKITCDWKHHKTWFIIGCLTIVIVGILSMFLPENMLRGIWGAIFTDIAFFPLVVGCIYLYYNKRATCSPFIRRWLRFLAIWSVVAIFANTLVYLFNT